MKTCTIRVWQISSQPYWQVRNRARPARLPSRPHGLPRKPFGCRTEGILTQTCGSLVILLDQRIDSANTRALVHLEATQIPSRFIGLDLP